MDKLGDVKLSDAELGDATGTRAEAALTAGVASGVRRPAPRKTFAAMIGRPQQFASQLAPLQDMLSTVSDMMQPETVAIEASAEPVSATPRFSLSLRKQ
jgi:hypothetical protein